MLLVAGFPVFLLIFVSVLAFSIWKIFSAENKGSARYIFEFYLEANEILRDDDRRWYGFEIQDAIDRGEKISASMKTAPPLVDFAIAALYQKAGDQSSAIRHFEHVFGPARNSEDKLVFPDKDLREYVAMLRRIERAPAESPVTASAVRSLERLRKNKGPEMFERSKAQAIDSAPDRLEKVNELRSVVDHEKEHHTAEVPSEGEVTLKPVFVNSSLNSDPGVPEIKTEKKISRVSERQSISELLHDIYDGSPK